MKSSKAVLLNMFQPDRDVLHHLTFEDNRRAKRLDRVWVCFFLYFLFYQMEHSASLMMDAEPLVMCKKGDNRS